MYRFHAFISNPAKLWSSVVSLNRSRQLGHLVAAGLLFATSAAYASPVTITTADGKGADNQVQGQGFDDREKINTGASSTLELRANDNPASNFVGVLRFDLAALPEQVAGATLRLTLASSPSVPAGLTVFALRDGSGGGADGGGGPELGEAQYAEGDQTFKVATGQPNALIGDNAPGFDESAIGPEMVIRHGTRIGNLHLPAGLPVGSQLSIATPALTQTLRDDRNGVVVFYLFNTNPDQSFRVFTADGNPSASSPTLMFSPPSP